MPVQHTYGVSYPESESEMSRKLWELPTVQSIFPPSDSSHQSMIYGDNDNGDDSRAFVEGPLSLDRRPLPCRQPQHKKPDKPKSPLPVAPVSEDESTTSGSDPDFEQTDSAIQQSLEEVSIPEFTSNVPSSCGDTTTQTQCDRALSSVTDTDLQNLMDEHPTPPASILRKEKWAYSLYQHFCEKAGLAATFPLDPKVVCGFLRFLAIHAKYSLSGIQAIIAPALRRMNLDKATTSDSFDKHLAHAISATIKQLKRNPTVKLKGTGKPPLCSFDLKELITRIPDSLPSKLLEASLFLFAHHTGSRALTCEAVKVGDIQQIEVDPSGLAVVVINLRVTKGNPQWNHPVVLEGYLNREHPLDAVYYLNAYVVSKFKMSLQQISDRADGQDRDIDHKSLWPLSREAMRERVKRRLSQTGFPDGFAFHSFRSGFLCSALMAAGADGSKKANVLETTALVAGWHVYGKAQRRYIKTVAERTIVASRLLGLGIGLHQDETSQDALPAQSSTEVASVGYIRTPESSESFHGFTLKAPMFSATIFRRALKQIFNEPFLSISGDTVRQLEHSRNCFNNVLAHWGREALDKAGKRHQTYNQMRKTD